MVTHDVGLKTYANRVVKMADGKVNKIMDIDPHERGELIRHLSERVSLIHKGQSKDILTIREGISEQDDENSKINQKEQAIFPDNVKFL